MGLAPKAAASQMTILVDLTLSTSIILLKSLGRLHIERGANIKQVNGFTRIKILRNRVTPKRYNAVKSHPAKFLVHKRRS